MTDLRIGFIGLGNVGGQLAGNLLRHGVDLTVRDIDEQRVAALAARGARPAAARAPRATSAETRSASMSRTVRSAPWRRRLPAS